MRKVKAKKHLGQHFLKDVSIAEEIVDQITIKENTILEIGPGMGVLTKFLINKTKNLQVIEIDKESVFYLRLHYPKLKIIEGDFDYTIGTKHRKARQIKNFKQDMDLNSKMFDIALEYAQA